MKFNLWGLNVFYIRRPKDIHSVHFTYRLSVSEQISLRVLCVCLWGGGVLLVKNVTVLKKRGGAFGAAAFFIFIFFNLTSLPPLNPLPYHSTYRRSSFQNREW